MTCRNYTNNIVVSFEKQGDVLTAKIKDIPIELLSSWASDPQGEQNMQNAVEQAEDVFLRAYFKADIEKNGIRAAF